MRSLILMFALAVGMGSMAWGDSHQKASETINKNIRHEGKVRWKNHSPDTAYIIKRISVLSDVKSKKARRYLFERPKWVENAQIVKILKIFVGTGKAADASGAVNYIYSAVQAGHLTYQVNELHNFLKVSGHVCASIASYADTLFAFEMQNNQAIKQLEQKLRQGGLDGLALAELLKLSKPVINVTTKVQNILVQQVKMLHQYHPTFECTQSLAEHILRRDYFDSASEELRSDLKRFWCPVGAVCALSQGH